MTQPIDTEMLDESWRCREHLHRCPSCLTYTDCGGTKSSPCWKVFWIDCAKHDAQLLAHGVAASRIGVTKNTLYRWEKLGLIRPALRDRNNHRLFTAEMVEQIKAFKNQEIPVC